jgi:DNA-binding Xre family transcriptional regulator
MKVQVFDSRGTISRALAEIEAEGGPGLDIPSLAEEAGVSTEWLHQLNAGQLDCINLEDLERICRVLGRSPNDITGYEADA